MAYDKYVVTRDKVKDYLEKGALHEAFTLLRKAAAGHASPTVSDRLSKLEETYRYMIHYMMEGYSDTGRDEMLSGLIAELHTVNDSILRNAVMADSPDIYSATKRFENIKNADFSSRFSEYRDAFAKSALASATEFSTEYRRLSDEALSALFSHVWTMFDAPEADYKKLSEAVLSNEFPFEFAAQMISALMLGCLSYFSKNAFSTLLDIYEADLSQKISARALVAILLIGAAHPDRIRSDRKLDARLSLWQDSIMTYPRLRETLMNVIRSRDTERISSKMQNEVLPELMKLRPEIIDKLKKVSEESDMEMLDVNPEWEELLDKNGLGDKLKELTEMQMEGGDVMMMAFSNLKTFPFFNQVDNWFIPFSPAHSEISGIAEEIGSFSELLDMEGVMCDSDKYSFAFSLSKMPESQRKMMTSRMDEQMAQLREMAADRKMKSSVPEFDAEVTRYVRDIYRFFKLFRRKEDFPDPFAKPLDFMGIPYLSDILSDSEIVNLVGEFYFKRGYYAEALPILQLIEKEEPDSTHIWEKIGYCHNTLNNIPEAIKWYKKAELINPESRWLLKKLAVCLKMMNRHEEAAEYYAKALESDPDNYSLLMSAGDCLLESGDIAAALSDFYHADYVSPGKLLSWRALGWAELLNCNKEKSLDFFRKLLDSPEPIPADYLNAGHLYYLTGNPKKAAECYRKCAENKDFGLDKLEKAIQEDCHAIEKAGGTRQELNLILDNVKYSL